MMNPSEDDKSNELNELEISEELLENVFEEIPPATIVDAVNPGYTAMDRIKTGIVLSCITLNFLCLNYILPLTGAILLLLGFRTLRRENKWFGYAYVCSVLTIVILISNLIFNATIYSGSLPDRAGSILAIATGGLNLVKMFCFWQAVDKLQEKAGAEEKSGGAETLFIWYVILAVLAIVGYDGWIILIGMIAAFVMIIKSLSSLSELLEADKYLVKAAPVKVADDVLVKVILGILAAGMLCGYLFFSEYPMDWNQTDFTKVTTGEIYDQLIALGYPEEQLNDLTQEDLELLEGADRVIVTNDRTSLGSSVKKTENLSITYVAVRIAGVSQRGVNWRIISHFAIDDGAKCRGTANILIWATESTNGWYGTGELSGRLLCRKDGADLTADFVNGIEYTNGISDDTADDTFSFWVSSGSPSILCDFSMPDNATDRRGYVAYSTEQLEDANLLNSWFNYSYQTSLIQYPVKTAEEHAREFTNILGAEDVFTTYQSAIQVEISDGQPVAGTIN